MTLKKPGKKIILENLKPKLNSKILLLGYDDPLPYSFNKTEGLIINIPLDILNSWNEETYAWTLKIIGEEIQ